MNKLYIVIPAYNEAATIKDVVKDWYEIVEKYDENGESRLVVIDDGSKDDTFQIMLSMKESRPLFIPLTKSNSGHGSTLLYGYRYALDHKADYIFQTDSDGQTLPDEFDFFWQTKEQYDMVIGYRNKRKDGVSRIFVTKVLKMIIHFCFQVNVTDANTPYRLMKAEVLEQLMSDIPENYHLPNVLIAVLMAKRKKSVKYQPITFRPRQGGINSINFKKIIGIGFQAVKDFTYINKIICKRSRQ